MRLEQAAVTLAQRGLAAVVGRVDDRWLARAGNNEVVVGMILRALARLVAAHEPTLRADILFVVATPSGDRIWTLRAREGIAGARPVVVVDPDLTLRLDLADLLGLAAARTTGVALLVKSRLRIEGSMPTAMALMRAVEAGAQRPASAAATSESEPAGGEGQ